MAYRVLTPEKVREARAWYARWVSTPTLREMARKLGINETNLKRLVHGETYRDIV